MKRIFLLIILLISLLGCTEPVEETQIENPPVNQKLENKSTKSTTLELSDQEIIELFNFTSVIVIENGTYVFDDLSLLSKNLFLKKYDCKLNKTIRADFVITNCQNQLHHQAITLTNIIFQNLSDNIYSINPPISKIIEQFNLTKKSFEVIYDRILSQNALDYLVQNNISNTNSLTPEFTQNNVLVLLDESNSIFPKINLHESNYFVFTHQKDKNFTTLNSNINDELIKIWEGVGNHEIDQSTINAFKYNKIINCISCNHTFYYNKGEKIGNFIYTIG